MDPTRETTPVTGVRVGLGIRVLLGFVVVLLLGDGISAALVDRQVARTTDAQVRERLTYEVTMLGQITANALFGPIDPADTSLSGVVKQLANAVHTDLSILAPDGTVVADSDVTDLAKLEKQANAPEVVDALASGKGVSVRPVGGEMRVFVAETIVRDGKTLGLARASVAMTAVNAAARQARRQMGFGGLVAAGVAAVVAAFIALGILRPVRKLAEGARKIGRGDLGHRIDVRTNDEIGDLARALNEMVRRLETLVGTLDRRNRDMRLVLDNVSQGLVAVDRDGGIAEERSLAVDRWFGRPKAGTKLWDLFAEADSRVLTALSLGWAQLFEGVLPVEVSLAQLPRRIRSGDRFFEVGCEPITIGGSDLDRCLIVLSDVTANVAAERMQTEQREQLCLFAAVAKDRKGVQAFLKETGAIVDDVLANASTPSRSVEVKRGIHTIKGNASLFGLTRVAALCDKIETRLADEVGSQSDVAPSQPEYEALAQLWASVTKRAHELLGAVSADAVDVTPRDVAELVASIRNGQSSDKLVGSIATWSLDRADRRLARLADQARELATRMGKPQVAIDVAPSSVRLSAELWAPLWGNLSHVLRNALDHGIEASADERMTAGKPAQGRLRFAVTETGDRIVVEIGDDGRGIDWTRLREKAIAAGIPAETEADLINALFTAGVTTRDKANEYSGRGVGLSAVRAACEAMGGRIEVESFPGKGTTLRFCVPLQDAAVRASSPP